MKLSRVTVVLMLCLSTIACGSWAPREKRVKNWESAGSVHVSVLAVKRWDEYKDKLQPAFTLDEKGALDAVLPITARVEEAYFQGLAASAKAALPGSTTSETTTVKKATGEPTIETVERVTEETPGDVGAVEDPASTRDRKASDLIGTPLEGNLAQDPMLRYLAATALLQEVEMLNTYVQDAAISQFYDAFIVRLQVGVMPFTRHLPYDVYTSISFLPDQVEGNSANVVRGFSTGTGEPTTAGAPRAATQQEALSPRAQVDRLLNALHEAKRGDATTGAPGSFAPLRILPLLVTDNIEATLRSSQRERVVDLSLAALASLKGVGLAFGINNYLDELQRILAQDLNSTLTVARASENTVSVRFGARQAGADDYWMAARTNNVTVLVLVRKDFEATQIKAVSISEFVDTDSGFELPGLGREYRLARAKDILVTYDPCVVDEAGLLLEAVARNDQGQFLSIIDRVTACVRECRDGDCGCCPHAATLVNRWGELWVELAQVEASAPISNLDIPLPTKKEPLLFGEQSVLAIDDGKATTATVAGGARLDSARLFATLHVTVPKPGGTGSLPPAGEPNENIAIRSRESRVAPHGDSVTFVFPSLKAMGLKPLPPVKLDLARVDDDETGQPTTVTVSGAAKPFAVRYALTTPESKPTLSLSADATRVGSKKGRIVLTIKRPASVPVKDGKPEFAIRLKDARISHVLLGTDVLQRLDDRWVVLKEGVVDLELEVVPGSEKVEIVPLFEKEPSGPPLELEVVAPEKTADKKRA